MDKKAPLIINAEKDQRIRIEKIYLNGGPLYWRDEQSGNLAAAIEAYLTRNYSDAPTPEQIDLMRAYLEYYVSAPCWNIAGNSLTSEIEKLKVCAENLRTTHDIYNWLFKAMEVGLDPL
jgi:hypothetical protein